MIYVAILIVSVLALLYQANKEAGGLGMLLFLAVAIPCAAVIALTL
jgi:hypothetical protein